MSDAFPTLTHLISESANSKDDNRWERVVQLFRPGILAWLGSQLRGPSDEKSDRELQAIVDELFVKLKPEFDRHLSDTSVEFSIWLKQTLSEYLRASDWVQQSSIDDTASFKLPNVDTKSIAPVADDYSVELLLGLLPQLADSTRVVASMRLVEGLKYREIATRTGIDQAEVVRLDREAQSKLLDLLRLVDVAASGGIGLGTTLDAALKRETP